VFTISAMGVFKQKFIKLVAVIVYTWQKGKSWFFAKTQWIVYLWGLSVFIYAKTVNSLFHLYGCGYPHNRIDGASLATGTPDLEDDPVALYLGYYD